MLSESSQVEKNPLCIILLRIPRRSSFLPASKIWGEWRRVAFDWPLISIWFNKHFWKWLVRLFYDAVKVLKPLNYIPKNGWNVNLEYITVKSSTLFPMSSFWVWRLRVANRLIHPFTEAQNSISKFLQCCLRCCFWCLEKMVKFLNRNAYIMVSRPLLVYGALALLSWPHVCPTAWRAFWYLVVDFVGMWFHAWIRATLFLRCYYLW